MRLCVCLVLVILSLLDDVNLPLHRVVFSPHREPLGTVGRFTITPQRHYPLQQPGVSSVGVLPPVKWDGFRKKNILSPRNSPAALSPVTVKIARPDHHSSPRSLHSRRDQRVSLPSYHFYPLFTNKSQTLYARLYALV